MPAIGTGTKKRRTVIVVLSDWHYFGKTWGAGMVGQGLGILWTIESLCVLKVGVEAKVKVTQISLSSEGENFWTAPFRMKMIDSFCLPSN